MLFVAAALAFLVATILEATENVWLFPSTLGWLSAGLTLLALAGGGWEWVSSKRRPPQ